MVILEELFESDLVMFLLVGFVVSAAVGLGFMRKKSLMISAIISVAVYAVCEIMLSTKLVCVFTGMFMQLISMFSGTAAIGTMLGFLICFVIKLIREKTKKQ